MPLAIPFSGATRESFDITLAERRVRLRTRFNTLGEFWTIDMDEVTQDGDVPIIAGIAVLLEVDLLKQHGLDMGSMIPRAASDPRNEARRGELGNRVRVLYFAPGETITPPGSFEASG